MGIAFNKDGANKIKGVYSQKNKDFLNNLWNSPDGKITKGVIR